MIKKQTREKELAKEKRQRRRRSSVFKEQGESQPIESECASFFVMPSVDQLSYWLAHKEQSNFQFFLNLVRVIFAVSAASSKSERVFSAPGNILTSPKRASLNPEKVKECVIALSPEASLVFTALFSINDKIVIICVRVQFDLSLYYLILGCCQNEKKPTTRYLAIFNFHI